MDFRFLLQPDQCHHPHQPLQFQTTLIQCPEGKAGSYLIPGGVTTIGGSAFADCTRLTEVIIPNHVTSIGPYAFYNCYNLLGVYFYGNAPVVGSYAFFGAVNATVYHLPVATGWGATFGDLRTAIWYLDQAPTVPTGTGIALDYFSATVRGMVNPNGVTSTAKFEYGLTTAYGNATSVTLTPRNGVTALTINANLTGLQSGQTYHFRLTATNNLGAGAGIDALFATPVLPFAVLTNNGSIAIIGYSGAGGAVTIPGLINGLPVTSIAIFAFYANTKVSSLTTMRCSG